MELDTRVADIEMELKVVKGEIKELLVNIRDLVNKSENPFCNSHRQGVSRFEAKEKEAAAENQKPAADEEEADLKQSADVSETWLENEKSKAIEPEIPVRKMDPFTMVELMRWVDYAVRTTGHSNLVVLLELYALTGQLSEETRYVIKNIANLSIEEPAGEDKVSMKDNITVLSQLSAILNPGELKNRIQPL